MRRHPSHVSRSCSHNTSHHNDMTFPFVSFSRLSRPLSLIRLIRNPDPCYIPVQYNVLNLHRQLNQYAGMDLLTSRVLVPMTMQQRFKKKKAAAGKDEEQGKSDDEDSDAEEAGDEEDIRNWDNLEADVSGYQIDFIVRGVFNMSREKAISKCNEGLVRLNNRTASKTDVVDQFDVVDLIRGRNLLNPDLLDISRAEITHVADHASSRGKAKIKAKRYKQLTIENYPEEPYKGVVQAKDREEEDWRGRVKTD